MAALVLVIILNTLLYIYWQ